MLGFQWLQNQGSPYIYAGLHQLEDLAISALILINIHGICVPV